MDYTNFSSMDNDFYDQQKEQLKLVEQSKKMDRGYNVIYRNCLNKRRELVTTPINIYTSGEIYSHIRDAETGVYYSHTVGSADEDLYFKVILATGECKSKNGSSTLFYPSPRQYMSHLNIDVSEDVIQRWEEKRDFRYKVIESNKNQAKYVIV